MKILAIETSCEHATLALKLDDQLLERSLDGHVKHSERLLPTLDELLSEAGIALSRLDAIAFGAGPGAFTGLRLACSVAQGLAMGADLGVVPVCSLSALGLQGQGERVLVATDARMHEIYTAVFLMREGVPETASPIVCQPPEQFALPGDGTWFVIGSALRAYPALLETVPAGRLVGVNAEAVPRAREVIALAEPQVAAGRCAAPEQVAPIYVRDKVALTTAERLARGGRA